MKLTDWMDKHEVTQTELAARVTALGRKSVNQAGVSQWLRKVIPADRVPELERITGHEVQPHDMRPDLYPAPERDAA